MPRLEPVTPDDIDGLSQSIERLVDQTPHIDRWCSGPDWVLPTNLAFAPTSERFLVGDPNNGMALLAAYDNDDGSRTISGLEPMWGFGSPILGPDPVAVMHQVAAALTDDNWDSLILPGLPVSQEILTAMAQALMPLVPDGHVSAGIAIEREIIDLSDGVDPWFARRSSRFRRNIRRAGRAAETEGVKFESIANDPAAFDRLLAIEEHSWKGKEESGISSPEMTHMYRLITDRLRPAGRLRATVATLEGRDVGFILGGVRHGVYRGLQLSYTDDVGHLSLGHLLQWQEINELADSDEVSWYDLGMSIEYKAQWADGRVPSPLLMAANGS